MISSGGFSPSCNSKPLFTAANAAVSFSPFKTQLGFAFIPHKSSTYALLAAVFQNRHLSFHGVGGGRRSTGFTVSARKKQQKGGAKVLEMDDSDDEFDLDGSDDELGLGGDGDEDDDTFVPFGKMKRWLEKKPRGFGEGKEYDVSIEEKLVEEIERNKQAQIENVIEKPKSKKDQQKNIAKANDVVEAGVRVRVLNLPKKKNIHRDLTAAFKLVPGLVSINPAVTGNKKTKDPICKGFAFVHFKSEKDATRFVGMFSSQSVTFGKIQKQIKCELVDPKAPNLDQKKSVDNRFVPRLPIRALEVDQKLNFDLGDSSLDTREEAILDHYEGSHVELGDEHAASQLIVSGQEEDEETDSDLDEWEDAILDEYEGSDVELGDEHAASQLTVSGQDEDEETDSELDEWEDTILDEYEGSDVEVVRRGQEHATETLESSSSSDHNGGARDSKILRKKFESLTADSVYLKQLLPKSKEEKATPSQKPVVKRKVESSPKKKKPTVKAKEVQIPKLSIGGSSKRLKVKEKAVLSDVFSKYGAKTALASQED